MYREYELLYNNRVINKILLKFIRSVTHVIAKGKYNTEERFKCDVTL